MARSTIPSYAVQVTAANTTIQAPNAYSDPTLLINTGVVPIWVQISQPARVADSIPLPVGGVIILYAPLGIYGIVENSEDTGEVRCLVGCTYYSDSLVDGEAEATANMLKQISETMDASREQLEQINKTLLRIRG